MCDTDNNMIKIYDNDNIISKKRKLNISGIIPPWKTEITVFVEHFKRIIIYNIHNYNSKKAESIINCTNFFDILDDLPVVMPLIYTVIKNNKTIKRHFVYIVILFLYYGLVLFDQNHNYLYTSDIKRFFNITDEEYDVIYNLIIEISCSSKDYASEIRKKIFLINN